MRVRFTLKSLGYSVANPASERFHKTVLKEVPEGCAEVIRPMVEVLEKMTLQIKDMERDIVRLAKESYPQAEKLRQITGVGPITSLYFVLKVGDVKRFGRTGHRRPPGLTPRRDQSGNTDKQLGITKCGDTYLRCLLVNAAQYIMGPFGPPGALREYGEKLRGTTGAGKETGRGGGTRKAGSAHAQPVEIRSGLRSPRHHAGGRLTANPLTAERLHFPTPNPLFLETPAGQER